MATNINSTRNSDSYAEVFQVVAIVVPLCPVGCHRLDIHFECFNHIMRNAVKAALGQYAREMDVVDRMNAADNGGPYDQQQLLNFAAGRDFPLHETTSDSTPDEASAFDAQAAGSNPQEEADIDASPEADCALDLTENTSSIVWALPLEAADPAESGESSQLPLIPNSPVPVDILDRRIQFSQDTRGSMPSLGAYVAPPPCVLMRSWIYALVTLLQPSPLLQRRKCISMNPCTTTPPWTKL